MFLFILSVITRYNVFISLRSVGCLTSYQSKSPETEESESDSLLDVVARIVVFLGRFCLDLLDLIASYRFIGHTEYIFIHILKGFKRPFPFSVHISYNY